MYYKQIHDNITDGGSASTLVKNLGISKAKAQSIVDNYQEGYKATMEFARKGEAFVKKYGYILISKITGLKLWWWDHSKWLEDEKYLQEHPELRKSKTFAVHEKAASKYGRLARNAPSQGEQILPWVNSLNSVKTEMLIPSQVF